MFFYTKQKGLTFRSFQNELLLKRYPQLKTKEFFFVFSNQKSTVLVKRMFVWSFSRGINFHTISALQICLSKQKLHFLFLFFLKKNYTVLDVAMFVLKKKKYYFFLLDKTLKTRFIKFFIFHKVIFFIPLLGCNHRNKYLIVHFCFLFFFFAYFYKHWQHFNYSLVHSHNHTNYKY